MEEKTYYLVNGFANGERFTATFEDAKKIAIKNSNFMNTRMWLHQVGVNGAIGHTERAYEVYTWYWKFVEETH
jgi:hypothetical protein